MEILHFKFSRESPENVIISVKVHEPCRCILTFSYFEILNIYVNLDSSIGHLGFTA